MFQSCFSCNHLSTSNELNPGKTAGLGRLNDLREAVNNVSDVCYSCANLAADFVHAVKLLPGGDKILVKSLRATSESLKDYAAMCKGTDVELKCFSKYFAKTYPKGGSQAGLIDPMESFFDGEVLKRGETIRKLAEQGFPVAHNAEYVLRKAAIATSQNLHMRLVQSIEDLERTAALHK